MRWIAEDSLNAALIAVNDPKRNQQMFKGLFAQII